MILQISPQYILCSWKRLPYAYMNRLTAEVNFISESDFKLLLKCNGNNDIKDNKDKIDFYLKLGVIQSGNFQKDGKFYKCYNNRYIEHAHWAITNRFNYKCKHCFISAPRYKSADLSLDLCKKIIDELHSCGIHKLSITGGEPLIRNDIFELISYISSKGIVITDIHSNGSLVTKELLSELQRLNISPTFHISFDGLHTHNWLRGMSFAEKQVVEAIKIIKRNGFTLELSYCFYDGNINTLTDNLDYCTNFKIDSLNFGLINNVGEWSNINSNKEQTARKILDLLLYALPSIVKKRYPFNINFTGFIFLSKEAAFYNIPMAKRVLDNALLHNWVVCESMRNVLYINPIGNLNGCEALTDWQILSENINILNEPLSDILSDGHPFMNFIDNRLKTLESHNRICPECNYYNICHSGCRANAKEIGNYWGIDPIACIYFKEGYYNKFNELLDSLGIQKQ